MLASSEADIPQWVTTAPYRPVFHVRDTRHKYGPYSQTTKEITLEDLIKFHGHLCGGLVEAACAARVAFDAIFPDGIVDRTDLRIVSSNSACGGDVVAYLTGARTRFGSHYIDRAMKGGEFIVQQVSTGKTVHVKRNPEVYPHEVKAQMKRIQSGESAPQDIDRFGRLQWAYAKRLIHRPLTLSFNVKATTVHTWPEPPCRPLGVRTDNDYKGEPHPRVLDAGWKPRTM